MTTTRRRAAVLIAVTVLATVPGAFAQLRVEGAVRNALVVAPEDAPGELFTILKVPAPDGTFRAPLEVRGVTLRSLLERAVIEKTRDDGFSRPLDVFVVAAGERGARAIFSWGELFAGADGAGVVVASVARLLMPHHHEKLDAAVFDAAAWLTPGARARVSLEACAACHDGKELRRIEVPGGFIVGASRDTWPPRAVTDVRAIEVRQVGVTVAAAKGETRHATNVEVVGVEGGTRRISDADVKRATRVEFRDAAVGMGRGYKGVHVWSGVRLRDLLARHLPAGTALGDLVVLVTSTDGYRCVLSGGELTVGAARGEVFLADREDGKPLATADGRFRLVVPGDAFVDRSVRAVREIRLLRP